MREPVLVIHGVKTRDKKEFSERVRGMNASIGNQWKFIPVFWGDLGVDEIDVDAILPESGSQSIWEAMLEAVFLQDEKEIDKLAAKYWYSKWAGPRRAITRSFALFLGDVLIYQNDYYRRQIHKRIENALPRGYGKKGRPISVLAHSLGGVVSFNMATSGRARLWIKNLVTFGSQPSLFYVAGLLRHLPKYNGSEHLLLPSSIQNWTNIVEPFDPLAFIMNNVFLLRNGEQVRDVSICRDNPLDDVHGCYWTDAEALQIIADSLQE